MREKLLENQSERLAVSVPELAELLGISQRHVWKLVARGVLQPVRLGRSLGLLHSDVLAVLETLKLTVGRTTKAARRWKRARTALLCSTGYDRDDSVGGRGWLE